MAVILLAWVIVATQVPVPEQAPDQPVNVDPGEGDAVNVTDVPSPYVSEQSPGQLIPAGEDVTDQGPLTVTERRESTRTVVDDVAVAPLLSVTLSTTV